MKNKKMFLKTLIATISTIGLISATSISASAAYSFDVISDTHIGADKSWDTSTKLETTFNAIKYSMKNSSYYKNEQCIVINGDVVDNSKTENYDELKRIVKNCKNDLPFVYFNIGNHEYASESSPYTLGPYSYGLNLFNSRINDIQSSLDTRGIVTNFQRNNSYDSQYINSKNDRLAFLGTDEIPVNPCSSSLSSNQLNWLTSFIGDNTYEGSKTAKGRKPMFIFSHQPVYDTTYGSNFDSWGYIYPNNSNVIKSALSGHPEIVMFTGHTHKQFSNNDVWNFDNFYSLGDSSSQIFSVPSIGEVDSNGPEGYHVTVYTDGIVVTGVKYTNAGCKTINTRTVDF
ncbi:MULTISPECIES: metallophosphoesterase [Clostridium]|uniref:Metallophosphoesterase n=1 Tax=Clostridium cibarium TaxID=2762247 RepID=A0ABR8PP79_9CLOT|nr:MULTISPECIES: metallophosphoesterase [Clostridium]MBD7909967.1 metallophosphoesterase [Clostridium cibarium]